MNPGELTYRDCSHAPGRRYQVMSRAFLGGPEYAATITRRGVAWYIANTRITSDGRTERRWYRLSYVAAHVARDLCIKAGYADQYPRYFTSVRKDGAP